jgi:enamine deaminase RidA (YjgF/YER057c/UK114 family)
MSVEARLKELGIVIEKPSNAPHAGNYVAAVRSGNLLYLSGKGPRRPDGGTYTGKVGADVNVEEAYQHARNIGLAHLATLQAELGSLDRVKRIVKLLGMVNATPDFTRHPEVINGCSDLFVQVFGDKGRHARSAVGMGSLPNGMTVEIEGIVEVE